MTVTRRAALTGAASLLAMPAVAQSTPVRFTLPWLAEGNSVYLIAGKQKGFFARHSIDIDISRGFGSLAAGQAIASGQFAFGSMITTPMILLAARNLPLTAVAVMDYDAGMGVGVLADSPITTPQQLAHRRIGDVPTSAEFPFFPAYAQRAGFDVKTIDFVNTDAKVLERVLSERQIDAMTGIASSSLPIFISKNIPVRWMLYSSVGLPSYGASLVTTRAMVEREPALCAALVDAACESLAWTLQEPEEAVGLFLKAMPEMSLNPGVKEFLRVGMGLHDYVTAQPEARANGLGYGDPRTLARMTDLVMQFIATSEMKRPSADALYAPQFGGKVRLTDAQWQAVESRTAPFARLLA